MGIRDEELMRASTGTASNPDALRSRMPADGLANTVNQRGGPASGPRAAFGAQPGAALNEAVNARTGPPTPSPIRLNAAQPGEALANAIQARAGGAEPMMAAQPRTSYLLGGGTTPPAATNPQTAALLQGAPGSTPSAPQVVRGADLAGAPQPAPSAATTAANTRAALSTQPGQGLNEALAGRAPAPDPAAATRAALSRQPGQAIAQAAAARAPVPAAPLPTTATPAPAAATAAGQAHLGGAPANGQSLLPPRVIAPNAAARPAAAPATATAAQVTPRPAPASPPVGQNFLQPPGQPNPNVAKGILSDEALKWQAEQAGQAGPRPAAGAASSMAPEGKPGLVSRLRGMFGLGEKAAAPGATPPPAAAPAPAAQPGAIRQAANTMLGSGEQWREFGGKALQQAKGAAKVVGKVAKPLAPVAGAVEMVNGALDGDSNKTMWGALDTAAGAGLYSPAAPVAGAYLAVRGGYEGGQALPETWRDAIGSGINKVAQVFGGGVDQATVNNYNRMNAEYDAREAAKAHGTAAPAMAAKPAGKPGGAIAQEAAKQGKGAPAPAAAPFVPAPAGQAAAPRQADPQMAALTQHYNALQEQLDANPIARTVLGGGQSAVYYKDGTVLNLQAGQPLPDDVQQFQSLGNTMRQIETGQYRLPASSGTAAAPMGGSADQKVAAFAAQYGPAAQAAAQKLGVDPRLLLAQFGNETGWGEHIIPGTNNLGNIKDFSGAGVAATDNLNGSRDKYMQFADPQAFMDHYADLISRKYPGAVGAGNDMQRFASALKQGGYAQDANYVDKLVGAHRMLGGMTFESSMPMQSPAVVALDGEAGPSAAGAGSASAGAPPWAQQPVQILRGMQDTMALPNGGGAGYTEVPTGVYQAGVRGGNASLAGRGPIADYAANMVQGEGFAANPAGAKLAGETIKANADRYVADQNLQGHKATADAHRHATDVGAESTKKAVVQNPEQVGVDPLTKAPIFKDVPYVRKGDGFERAVPQQNWPAPSGAAIAELRRTGDRSGFDRTFGPGAADAALTQKAK